MKQQQSRIFLIGFMGSGKTSVGKHLAEILNTEFIDLDDVIENNEGKTISQIFQEHGEEYFREKETQSLKSLSEKSNSVIATGGGTPCFQDNMNWMNKNGSTVYLKVDPAILLYRLRGERIHRPLIKNYSEEELRKFINEKLKERSAFYNSSRIIVDASEVSAKEMAEKIKALSGQTSFFK